MEAPEHQTNYLLLHWRGGHSLSQSFWVNCVLVVIVLGMFNIILMSVVAEPIPAFLESDAISAQDAMAYLKKIFFSNTYIFMSVLGHIVWIWQIVGLWRSASVYNSECGFASWGGVVKLLIFFSTAVYALVLLGIGAFFLAQGY